MASVQKISPFLMFDGPVEEAAEFYISVFPNSEIMSANRVMQAMFKMKNIVAADLDRAAAA